MTKLKLISGIIVLLTACTSTPVAFIAEQPTAEKGSVIYVYRPSLLANAIVSPSVMLNGAVLFELENGTYQYRYVAAGKQLFSLELGERYQGNKNVILDVKPETSYFLRVTSNTQFEMNKPYTRTFTLQQVTSSIAMLELASMSKARPAMQKQKQNEASQNLEAEAAEFTINKSRNPFSK